MYTYLEDIENVKTTDGFCHNLIGQIKDIEHVCEGIDYYQFLIYNRRFPKGHVCVCKPEIFQGKNLTKGDSIVIEYAPVKNFKDIGNVFLIRKLDRPILNMTGDKSEDVKILMKHVKHIIETQFRNGQFDHLHHRQMNEAYIKFIQTYGKCHKEVKW